jgi:CelD/BcsL family acetyltransferase involved in cellulose biosynthesis
VALHLDVPAHSAAVTDTAAADRTAAVASEISLAISASLEAAEPVWRAFEQTADRTVFQGFGWISAWMRNIGARDGTVPAIVIGRDPRGEVLFLMPFAVERRSLVRRLVWLGSSLADYNAPLLARNFASLMCEQRFAALWKRIVAALMADRRFRHDAICLEKMPDTVGGQRNPFTYLPVALNPSGAHVATLFGDWETYYFEKRSSGTRKNDRAKRKKLGEIGEVRMVDAGCEAEARRTLAALFSQKARQFARMGVADIFARPGHAEFYADLATGPDTRGFVHVSRLEVGGTVAAANFGALHAGRYYHLVAAYTDGEAARFGPGAAHLRELLRTAIERGCREFDFTIGDEAYKREWADRTIALHDLHGATTAIGWFAANAVRVLARVKRTIKQTPVLWQAFTRTRALSGLLARRAPDEAAAAKPEKG